MEELVVEELVREEQASQQQQPFLQQMSVRLGKGGGPSAPQGDPSRKQLLHPVHFSTLFTSPPCSLLHPVITPPPCSLLHPAIAPPPCSLLHPVHSSTLFTPPPCYITPRSQPPHLVFISTTISVATVIETPPNPPAPSYDVNRRRQSFMDTFQKT